MPFSNLFDVSKISIFPSSIISFSNYLHSDSLKTENLLPNYFLNFLMANWLQPSIFFPTTDKKMSSLYLRDVLQCLLGSQLCRKFAQKIIGLSLQHYLSHLVDSFPLVSFRDSPIKTNTETQGLSLNSSPAVFYLLHIFKYD